MHACTGVAGGLGACEPTIKIGEQVVAGKKIQPKRGDLVVFHFTHDGADLNVIQRVVGLPGDRVACPSSGASGRCDELIVNGQPLPEPYVNGSAGVAFPKTVVPVDQLRNLMRDTGSVSGQTRCR